MLSSRAPLEPSSSPAPVATAGSPPPEGIGLALAAPSTCPSPPACHVRGRLGVTAVAAARRAASRLAKRSSSISLAMRAAAADFEARGARRLGDAAELAAADVTAVAGASQRIATVRVPDNSFSIDDSSVSALADTSVGGKPERRVSVADAGERAREATAARRSAKELPASKSIVSRDPVGKRTR